MSKKRSSGYKRYRSNKKSNYRKRKSYTSRLLTRKETISNTVFPDVYICKLRYTDVYHIYGSTGYGYTNLSGNSIYDPDATGTGHQPMYHDQLAVLYNNYRVIGSKIVIEALAGTEGLNRIAVAPRILTSSASDINALREAPYSSYKTLTGYQAKGEAWLKRYMATNKMFGIKSILYDDTTVANMTANPSQRWYWQIGVQAVDELAYNAWLNVTVTYYVRCENRIQQSQS